MRKIVLISVVLLLTSCTPGVPRQDNNICQIFSEYPKWYHATRKSQQRWGVPIAVQMAIMRQESHFAAKIKPERKQLLGFIPYKRPSSSYGYTQALNSTWRSYEKSVGHSRSRSSFKDAADFVGWYGHQAHRRAGIAYDDAYDLYLAYHEGVGGYQRKTYQDKTWLIHVAKRVQTQANTYQWQLKRCEKKFERSSWWFF